jgi:asparagine synthase (glutamine-hydrolysing)
MPGIAGIIRHSPSPNDARDLEAMLRTMQHTPATSTNRIFIEECGLHVGWALHEGAFADCMPLVSAGGNTVVVFDGETFDRAGDANGSVSPATPNAASLLDPLATCGVQYVQQLNGWFAGVIANRAERRVVLFNDRYAMRRIYYSAVPGEFVFASEAKALLRIRPQLRRMNVASLASLLRYNCVLGDETLFQGISQLPPASAWTFERTAAPKKATYFRLAEWEEQPPLDATEFYAKWVNAVSAVVPRYAREGAQVAVSMTAGLDTRVIAAGLRATAPLHPTYTFNGAWRELLDVQVARKAAALQGQTFEVIAITEDFLRRFGEFATRAVYISDGTYDACGAHDVFFNERARAIAPIRLTGKFGSEIVRTRPLIASAGYRQGFLAPELGQMVASLPSFRDLRSGVHPLTRVLTDEIAGHEYPRVAVEQSQLTLRTPYMDNDLVALMYRAPLAVRNAGDLQERYVKDQAPELARFVTNLGRFAGPAWASRLAYYPYWTLFKIEYLYLYAMPHWVTRVDRALPNLHLEYLFAGRQKWEGHRIWMKTHFADFVRETLLDPRAEYTRYFAFPVVSQMVERHLAGTHNYLHEINKALTVQLICASLLRS